MKSFFFHLLKGFIIESTIVLTMVLIASFFMQSITAIVPVALLILGKNFFLRAISLTVKTSSLHYKNALIVIVHFFMAAQFAYLFNAIVVTLLHEMGHAAASYAMYANPNPSIQIYPFSGGETSYLTDNLSVLGRFLGVSTASAIVSAAGSFVTMVFSFILLFISHKKKQTSALFAFLATSAIYAIASDAIYAHSALNSTLKGHDFIGLWKVGIHPLFSSFFLLLTPFLFLITKLRVKKS